MPDNEQNPTRRRRAFPASDDLLLQLGRDLDSSSRTPLYEQLQTALAQLIETNRLTAGTALPPEPQFASLLGVSRQTVSQALSVLARRGMLTRRRGAGTTIATPCVEQPLDGLYSFLRTLLAQGREPALNLLGYRLTVKEQPSLLLAGDARALIFEISFLRLANAEPMVIETIYLPRAYGEALPLDRFEKETLYELLQEQCGVTVTHAEETLQPITLRARAAALLQAGLGDAAFLVERVGYAGETPVEVRRSILRGDRYRFRARLAGPALPSE